MHNYLVIIIAMLKSHGLLTGDQAEKLAGEIEGATIPDSYEAAQKLIDNLYLKFDIKQTKK